MGYTRAHYELLECLQARKTSLQQALQHRENRENDFTAWRLEPTEELKGRLWEVKNTLSMLGVDQG